MVNDPFARPMGRPGGNSNARPAPTVGDERVTLQTRAPPAGLPATRRVPALDGGGGTRPAVLAGSDRSCRGAAPGTRRAWPCLELLGVEVFAQIGEIGQVAFLWRLDHDRRPSRPGDVYDQVGIDLTLPQVRMPVGTRPRRVS